MIWLTGTLRQYPEIAVFLALGIGYWVGGKSFKGFSLGAVTATLLAAIAIGQLGITISPNVKSVFFLMFLFAVGYGVGPQFVRGIAKDGIPQALFSAVQCVLCLATVVAVAKVAGYSLGSAAGLFAGSQTISASIGLATDAINRLGLPPDQVKALLDAMPTAYAVSYIFGAIGSALILALLGPKLLGIDLVAACKDYETRLGAKELGGPGQAWHQYELRAYKIPAGSATIGKTVGQAEAAVQAQGSRLFIERIRRGGKIGDAKTDVVLQTDDIVAIAGTRGQLVSFLGPKGLEIEDPNCWQLQRRASMCTLPTRRLTIKLWTSSATCPPLAVSFFRRSSVVQPKLGFLFCRTRGCTEAIQSRSLAVHRTPRLLRKFLVSWIGRPTSRTLRSWESLSPSEHWLVRSLSSWAEFRLRSPQLVEH